MSNYRVAWVLLASYVALLAMSSSGITLSFFLPVRPKPIFEKANLTEADLKPTPSSDRYNRYDRNQVPDAIKKFADETSIYSNYWTDLRIYLVIPCGVSILVTIPLVLGGLCSRKLFSSSASLYSSVSLWGLNLAGMITYQNEYYDYFDHENFAPFITILGVQIGMLLILTLQVIIAAWELRRQKISWPVINLSQIFSLNCVFLVTRIVVGFYMLAYYNYSRIWQGLRDQHFNSFYEDYDYWTMPKIKTPEYMVYPLTIVLLYGAVVPCESFLSHLLGHVNTKMLSFTTMMSAVFYGGAIVVFSPAFLRMIFATPIYPETMNWAIGLFFLSLVHGIFNLTKPSLLNAPASISHILVAAQGLRSTGYTSDDVKNRATALRRKFKGSDTLLFNSIIMILCSLALILVLCSYPRWWGSIVMLCADAVVLSRVVPAVIMETVTQKVESVPVLKMLMQVFIECVLLLVGSIGSFDSFYDETAAAIIFHFCVVIMQLYKVVKNPELRVAAKNLSTEQTSQSETRQQISERLLETDSSVQEEEEEEVSGRIYQPAV